MENKGQVREHNGKPVPEVLFLIKNKGADLYVTTKGLVYVFTRLGEQPNETAGVERFLKAPIRNIAGMAPIIVK